MLSGFGDVTWKLTDIFVPCLALEIFPDNFHKTLLSKSDVLGVTEQFMIKELEISVQ
jgi:hypothetical protein